MDRKYLFNTEKFKYITGDKPDVECILCEIRDKNPEVKSLEITRTDHMILTVNLYPFNAGHLMVFPKRHIVSYSEMNSDELLDLGELTKKAVTIIEKEFNPVGFNIGLNLGDHSGASISHIHQHIVPRYNNEIGFLDVLGGTRVMVVDPCDGLERIKKYF